jgi:CBS domain-containing protein
LGFFRTFVLERSGEHRHELDLKLSGTVPIVNAARVFALDALIQPTNTIDRLNVLAALNYGDTALLHDMREAFEFLLLLRMEHQLDQARTEKPASNYIDPATLTPLQKSLLRDAFQTSARAQEALQARFATAIWPQLRDEE